MKGHFFANFSLTPKIQNCIWNMNHNNNFHVLFTGPKGGYEKPLTSSNSLFHARLSSIRNKLSYFRYFNYPLTDCRNKDSYSYRISRPVKHSDRSSVKTLARYTVGFFVFNTNLTFLYNIDTEGLRK